MEAINIKTIIAVIYFSNLFVFATWANPDNDDITFEDDPGILSDKENQPTEKIDEEDDLEKNAEDEINQVANQVEKGENPIKVINYDPNANKKPEPKDSSFQLSFCGGMKGGLLDLQGINGPLINISPIWKPSHHFSLQINLGLGFLMDGDLSIHNSLELSVESAVNFFITKTNNPDLLKSLEGFILLRTGYISQEFLKDNNDYVSTGISIALGAGMEYYLSRNFHLVFKLIYDFPIWFSECADQSGQNTCRNPSGFNGHFWTFLSGIKLIF